MSRLVPLRPGRRSFSPAPSLSLPLRPHRCVIVLALGSGFDGIGSTTSSSTRGCSARLFGAPAPSSPKSSGYTTSGPPFATPTKNAESSLRGPCLLSVRLAKMTAMRRSSPGRSSTRPTG